MVVKDLPPKKVKDGEAPKPEENPEIRAEWNKTFTSLLKLAKKQDALVNKNNIPWTQREPETDED